MNDGTDDCMISSSMSTSELNISVLMIGQSPRITALAHSALSRVRSSSVTFPSPSTSEPAAKPRIRSACHMRCSKSVSETLFTRKRSA